MYKDYYVTHFPEANELHITPSELAKKSKLTKGEKPEKDLNNTFTFVNFILKFIVASIIMTGTAGVSIFFMSAININQIVIQCTVVLVFLVFGVVSYYYSYVCVYSAPVVVHPAVFFVV